MFPPRLLEKMLETPSNDMFYIESVGEAAAWNITIAPINVDLIPEDRKTALLNLFGNLGRLLNQDVPGNGLVFDSWSQFSSPKVSQDSISGGINVIFPLYQGQYEYQIEFPNVSNADFFAAPSEERSNAYHDIAYSTKMIAANRDRMIVTGSSYLRHDTRRVSIASATYLFIDPETSVGSISVTPNFWFLPSVTYDFVQRALLLERPQ